MKTVLFTAALMMGTAAIAQTTPPAETPPTPPTEETMPAPADTPPPPAEATPMPAPDSAAPPPAAAPAGQVQFNTPPTVEQKFPPPPPKAEYPFCSRTVTDGCVQRNDPGNRKK